ncbi:proline-specific permease [Metarhizium album ARSEF 1941]|uniref:Proline-specific permease n=1 Tax=Metarhizium album (strain ARSEF 1941) TaxID=1081103 RepID=A0A0B2WUV3_METAS|nr:proline-specific permease [Metarhizium album ARSEF 1941]KHN99851.1 proline-specific permease [Metarhizium album ARSEF 1941]
MALPADPIQPTSPTVPGHSETLPEAEPPLRRRQQHIGKLDRRLESRHVQFLALSGAIGTGLFVGTGQVLSLAGPLSALICYAVTGFNLYCVINSLGEMAAWLPVPGAVPIFAARYVDAALGFTLGWNYWYQFAIGVTVEVTVCGVVVDYWPNAVPKAALMTALLAAMVLVNCLPVRVYAEAEFVFGALKLVTIVGLILLMFIITLGGSPAGRAIGFRYWRHPGPMNTYLQDGALGRLLAFCKVFVQATFAYGGSEMVVVASGETKNPRRNIPRAIRRVFWRIAVFYVLSVFLVGLCVSSADPELLNAITNSAPGAAQSPFVIAIQNAGIRTLPSVINAVILTSAWSAGNSFFYASTRVLYAAALDDKAPSVLKWERFGVPYGCVAATTALSCLVYLNANNRSAEVFFWISNLSAVSTLIVWASVCYTYLRFYHGLRQQGVSRAMLPYKAPLQPFLAYFALVFCLAVALFNGFDAFFPGKFSAKTLVPPYIDIPIFLALFLGYKSVVGTRLVSLAEMDLWSGKAEIDRLEGTWEVNKPRNWLERIWFWIA